MQLYNNKSIYTRLERITSILVLTLQAITLMHLLQTYNETRFITLFLAVSMGYILTDFINGFVHMYMDNNTHYKSIVGPFITSFHLHHSRPRYTERHPLQVYFYESGTKFWLLAYLFGVFLAQHYCKLSFNLNTCLVSIGIFSSIAEVSHYWCHNATSKNKIIRCLQNCRILLSKQHHIAHHQSDNTNYAFLNGITDPLLNKISHYCYAGYKNHSDEHTAAYINKCLKKNQL